MDVVKGGGCSQAAGSKLRSNSKQSGSEGEKDSGKQQRVRRENSTGVSLENVRNEKDKRTETGVKKSSLFSQCLF